MYGYIYLTTDLETNLIYVGQKKSKSFLGKKYLGSGTTIQALLGSGATAERFEITMIDTAESQDELNTKEIFWIKKYDAQNPQIGYNRCNGGVTNAGFKQSSYQKEVAAEYMRNRQISEETRKSMSASAHNRTSNRVTNNEQVWMTDGVHETMATSEEVIQLLDQGYYFGRTPKTEEYKVALRNRYRESTYMMKNNQCILVANCDIQQYQADGWTIQRNCYSDKRNANVSRSKSGTYKIIHPDTQDVRYVKPDDFPGWELKGYVRTINFKKKTL